MDLKNRMKIEIFLKEGLSLKSIANKLEVSVSTVSREIKRNKIIEQNLKNTDKKEIKSTCELLKLPPYVCNGCPRYLNKTCTKHYEIYCSNIANEKSFSRKSAANIKNIDKRIEIVKLLNDLLSKKQTIGHIHSVLKETYPNDAPTIQTIYNWIKKGIIKHNLKKYRKKHKEIKEKIEYKKLSEYLKGKELEDFEQYCLNNNNSNICEIDLICGPRGTNGYLLVIFMPRIQFTLIYKLNNKTPMEVVRVFDKLEKTLGIRNFKKLFSILIADRGSEFLKYEAIEKSIQTNGRRTRIFYCDSGKPYQKAYVENINKLIRVKYPKGTNLEKVTQEELNNLVNNINSLRKTKYKEKTPNELFIERFNRCIFNKLSLSVIDKLLVNLN